ncbi:hypothetical protein BCE02nite_22960 [Brevibacillus centrosporus]|nr:hypothetical protein BCE02nite_22960 [Brevibacillus centrosporus]
MVQNFKNHLGWTAVYFDQPNLVTVINGNIDAELRDVSVVLIKPFSNAQAHLMDFVNEGSGFLGPLLIKAGKHVL